MKVKRFFLESDFGFAPRLFFFVFTFISLTPFLIPLHPAQAALPARIVEVEEADLLEEPRKDGRVIRKLAKGTPLAIANFPTETGFYKVRTAVGEIGWMVGTALQKYPRQKSVTDDEKDFNDERFSSETGLSRKKIRSRFRLSGFYGFDFFPASEIYTPLGIATAGSGGHFGVDLTYLFLGGSGLMIRYENLSKTEVINDQFSSPYRITFATQAIMGGLGLKVLDAGWFRMHMNILYGFALGAKASATATILGAPNVTTFGSGAPTSTALAVAGVGVGITEMFTIYADAGYRVLQTTAAAAATIGNGGAVYDSSSASYAKIVPSVNLSGVVANIGIAATF